MNPLPGFKSVHAVLSTNGTPHLQISVAQEFLFVVAELEPTFMREDDDDERCDAISWFTLRTNQMLTEKKTSI